MPLKDAMILESDLLLESTADSMPFSVFYSPTLTSKDSRAVGIVAFLLHMLTSGGTNDRSI